MGFEKIHVVRNHVGTIKPEAQAKARESVRRERRNLRVEGIYLSIKHSLSAFCVCVMLEIWWSAILMWFLPSLTLHVSEHTGKSEGGCNRVKLLGWAPAVGAPESICDRPQCTLKEVAVVSVVVETSFSSFYTWRCEQESNTPPITVCEVVMLQYGCTDVSVTKKEMTVLLINEIVKSYEYSAQNLNVLFSSAWETSFTLEAVWFPYLHPAEKLIYEQRTVNAKTHRPFCSSSSRLWPVKFVKTDVTVPLCFREAICSILECLGLRFPRVSALWQCASLMCRERGPQNYIS